MLVKNVILNVFFVFFLVVAVFPIRFVLGRRDRQYTRRRTFCRARNMPGGRTTLNEIDALDIYHQVKIRQRV